MLSLILVEALVIGAIIYFFRKPTNYKDNILDDDF